MNKDISINKGFSLIELSIVLVILGLLTGGILAGKNLIRAAELRAISTESDAFVTAVNAFKLKYLQYPGDMDDATRFWGARASCPGNYWIGAAPAYERATCDGNGDGQIGMNTIPTYYEALLVWQHLSNAELIKGNYIGLAADNNPRFRHDPGVNCPESKAVNVGCWGMFWIPESGVYASPWFAAENFFPDKDRNVLMLGGTGVSYMATEEVISPIEMWQVDKKLDDSYPDTGNLRSLASLSGNTPCHDVVAGRLQYRLDTETHECQIVMYLD